MALAWEHLCSAQTKLARGSGGALNWFSIPADDDDDDDNEDDSVVYAVLLYTSSSVRGAAPGPTHNVIV